MFDDEYEFDYDRVVEDTDELYDDEDFWSEDIYDEDELDNEQPFLV